MLNAFSSSSIRSFFEQIEKHIFVLNCSYFDYFRHSVCKLKVGQALNKSRVDKNLFRLVKTADYVMRLGQVDGHFSSDT